MQKKLFGPEQKELTLKKDKTSTKRLGKGTLVKVIPEEETKDLDNLKPIDHAVIAKPHTPVYRMHRWYARRPHSVFRELVEHYSNPGSLILDPFCGGGVTVYESLKLGRRVIGVDIVPLAIFITEMETTPIQESDLEKAFSVIDGLSQGIENLYTTRCSECNEKVATHWFEWSTSYNCNRCAHRNIISKIKKLKAGLYQCEKCKQTLRPSTSPRNKDEMVSIYYECDCGDKRIKEPSKEDIELCKRIEKEFESTIKSKGLWYPTDEIPPSWKIDKWAIRDKGFTHFYKFFTKRNILANAELLKIIRDNFKKQKKIFKLLLHTFSASLRYTNRMVLRNEAWRGNKPLEWAKHAYWIPEVYLEASVVNAFSNRKRAFLRGVRQLNKELGETKLAKEFSDLEERANYMLISGSSTNLGRLPDCSIDAVITDPPYGENVQYSELANFWTVWLKKDTKYGGLINSEEEIVINPFLKKDVSFYRSKLFEVFKECYRVLKPNRWMVMTFHNREFKVWNAIHLAAHDAGFVLPEKDGMVYQPPIRHYTQTIHTRASGAMLGDFILSFQKARKLPKKKMIAFVEVGKRIQELAAECVLHHGGAALSTIYMKIMPFLLNNDLLEEVNEANLTNYLKDNFEERNGKWHLREKYEAGLEKHLTDYSKSHYKSDYRVLDFIPVEARIEYLVRRLLYEKGKATQDEILNEIFTNLINSNAADYQEISRVLNRIAVLVPGNGRKVWRLKEDVDRQLKLEAIEEKVAEVVGINEESEHDLVIRRLVELGAIQELSSHIGKTEQNKYTEFRRLSIPMANNVQYGLSKRGFEIIREIDVLWLKGDSIMSAFEVERSSTIDSGINRIRNLLAAQPNISVEAFLVIPDRRENELKRKLDTPANRKEGLVERVEYIKFSDLRIDSSIGDLDLEGIKYKVA